MQPPLFVLLLLLSLTAARSLHNCKCAPGDPCWPSDADFNVLNRTVSGRLIRGVPPASVCYRDQPNYNASACAVVAASWFSSTFHASDPVSVGYAWWANTSCPAIFPNGTSVTGDPDAGNKGCSIGGYPVYSLNATDTSQVQAVVRFANMRNIRLNVKSTGHSFQGRSTAYGSISIWTHNFRGAQWHDNFQPRNCSSNGTQMAATFAAGERGRNVYEFTASHNAVAVAGSAQDVGYMGWFTGGGHGPLSSDYGMGADNVLQIEVVTPTGEVLTANACQHPDIFWAIRGGGGGTFGVVTSVTMKTYPSPQSTRHSFELLSLNGTNSTEFLGLVAKIFAEFPRLKVGGMQGYLTMYPPELAQGSWYLGWGFNLYDKPNGTADALFTPIAKMLDPLNGTSIYYTTETVNYPNFFALWNATIGDEPVGASGAALGSRLLPASALADPDRMRQVLETATSSTAGGGPGLFTVLFVANSDRRGNNIAMNPAWRDTVMHVVVTEGFPDWDNFTAAKQTFDRVTYVRTAALKSLAPESGAYINEADPYDPNWQYDFFGKNYPRLKAVKEKYDPKGTLYCIACVGSEDWIEVEQQSGHLCRADWATRCHVGEGNRTYAY